MPHFLKTVVEVKIWGPSHLITVVGGKQGHERERHHCIKSGNIQKTEGDQIHLYFMTVL